MQKDNPAQNPAHAPIIVTGLSGAGLSSALKTLEDMGYEVFDNFPLGLVAPLLQEERAPSMPVAIGVDSRTRGFSPESLLAVRGAANAKMVFLTCDDSVLQKRFTETRRRHPVARDRPVSAGIRKEREWLHPLRAEADMVVDTTELSVHDLRHVLEKMFTFSQNRRLTVTVLSFGYRFGVPRDADLVMDVRFLTNPHWVPALQAKTGLDEPVGTYIAKDPDFTPFMEQFGAMITPLLPRYAHEGKSYLSIAFGCTGGRHRSVYTAEKFSLWLRAQGYETGILHRDIDRAPAPVPGAEQKN